MVIATLLALFTVTGCGGDDGGEVGGAGGEGAANGGEISVEPKTIGVVSLGLGSPIANAHVDIIRSAGEALGWEILVADGAYDPAKIGAAVQSYVDRRVDAIITESSEASAMRSGLTAAQREDIPVIGTTGGVLPSDLFTALYTEDETQMGKLGGEAILEAVEDPKVLNLKVSAASSGVARDEALKQTLPDGAIVSEHDIDLGNPVASTQRAVDAALSQNPDINMIYAVYDTLLQPMETTVRRNESDAKAVSYFATPDNIERLTSASNPLVAAVSNDLAKTGAVAIDQLVAHFEKGAPIDPDALEKNPLTYTVLTKDNVEEKLEGKSELFPNEEILAPFLERWKQEYSGGQ